MQAIMSMRQNNDPDDLDLFMRIIPLLDSAWLDDHYREQESKKARDKNKRR